MFDLVRSSYGYSDEYILGKTMKWLESSVDLILRRKHDETLKLSSYITYQVGSMFSSKKTKPLPSYDEMKEENKDKDSDENFMADDLSFFSK
jgi:hypothetical protein